MTSDMSGNREGAPAESLVTTPFLVRVSAFGLAVTALAGSFTIVVLPTRVEDLVSESSKNTALGVLSFVGLLIAVLVQPIAGGASDRKSSRWGRRAPFIAIGGMAAVPLLVAVGAAPSYALLFFFTCALQLFSNAAQGPYQALIRDYVPHAKRGAASGIKWLVEIIPAIGVTALVAWLIGRYDDSSDFAWVWLSLGLLAALLAAGVVVTVASLRRAPVVARAVEATNEAEARPHPHYKRFLASRFLLAVSASSLQTFLLFILEDRMGIENPAKELWKIFSITGAGALLVIYPAARLSDRVGRKPVLLASGAFGLVTGSFLLPANSLGDLMFAGAVAGPGLGMYLGANWALATDLVSGKRAAQQLGYLNVATAAGAGVARLNGIWVDRLNARSDELGYTVLIVLCGIVFAAGNALILFVRTNGAHPPAAPLPKAST